MPDSNYQRELSRLSISIVLPTHKRVGQLGEFISALGALDWTHLNPANVELVVVDDGFTVPVGFSLGDPGISVRLIHQEQTGPAGARNAGARVAKGSLLVFVDDDCRPRTDWLEELALGHAAHPSSLIGGTTNNTLASPFARCSQAITEYVSKRNLHRQDGFVPTSNLAVPAEEFWTIDGFDASFPLPAGEDRDFCERWSAAGRTILRAPNAIVEHSHHMGAGEFVRQHHRYGRGARHLMALRSERDGPATRPEPPSFYWGMVEATRAEGVPLPLAVLLVGLSQAVYLVGVVRGSP